MATKYIEIKKKEVDFLKFDKNIVLTENQLKNVASKFLTNGHTGRKINKTNNAYIIDSTKRKKVLKNARENGFFKLNGFADCYRRSIKISYTTLYRRILTNKDIQKTLIEKNIISIYERKKDLNNSQSFNLNQKETKRKKCFMVNYEKRREFIHFIKEYFLTHSQKYEKV